MSRYFRHGVSGVYHDKEVALTGDKFAAHLAAGWVACPERPSPEHEWQGGAWVYVEPAPEPVRLSPGQWLYGLRANSLTAEVRRLIEIVEATDPIAAGELEGEAFGSRPDDPWLDRATVDAFLALHAATITANAGELPNLAAIIANPALIDSMWADAASKAL